MYSTSLALRLVQDELVVEWQDMCLVFPLASWRESPGSNLGDDRAEGCRELPSVAEGPLPRRGPSPAAARLSFVPRPRRLSLVVRFPFVSVTFECLWQCVCETCSRPLVSTHVARCSVLSLPRGLSPICPAHQKFPTRDFFSTAAWIRTPFQTGCENTQRA